MAVLIAAQCRSDHNVVGFRPYVPRHRRFGDAEFSRRQLGHAAQRVKLHCSVVSAYGKCDAFAAFEKSLYEFSGRYLAADAVIQKHRAGIIKLIKIKELI